MLWPKKNHTKNLITKKIPEAQKFPSPITFLMVGPLVLTVQDLGRNVKHEMHIHQSVSLHFSCTLQ